MNIRLNRLSSCDVLDLLHDKGALSVREICSKLKEGNDHKVRMVLRRLWNKRIVLRTKKPVFLSEKVHRGRAGSVYNTRAVNYYAFNDNMLGWT